MSLVHDCEFRAEVPYREEIVFPVVHISETTRVINYQYFARRLSSGLESDFSRLESIGEIQTHNLSQVKSSRLRIFHYADIHGVVMNLLSRNPYCLVRLN
jgi:hypothetical protein